MNYIIFSASYILLQPSFQALESFFGFNPKNSNLIINISSRLNSYQWYRAVQQKVEGRFNHGVNFFDAFCHQDGVSLFVWTQQLHHTMTSCAQSTFTFLSAKLCNGLLLESVPAMAFVEHKSPGTACSNSMPGTAGTRLVLHLERYLCRTSLELNTSREPEPGPSCMQAGPALRNFAGEHFLPYVTSLCLQSVSGSAVWIQTWRAPCPHSGTTRFWPSFQWISAPVFLCLQPAKFYAFTEFSLKCWIHWRLATLLYTNCPGRPPETGYTLAITYHVHVPHAYWTWLGLTATATAVAWTVTEVRAWS